MSNETTGTRNDPSAPLAPGRGGPEDARTLRALARCIPPELREKPTSSGMAYLARDIAVYVAALGLLTTTDFIPALLVGWFLAAMSIAGLFVLGHDAAHGSLFESALLNRVASRVAMLPSLHASSVWAYGHNRVHHAFPGCEGLDFVWHPVTPDEYRGMSPRRRLLHRIEWSRFGAGIYYARAVWWSRLVRLPAPASMRRLFLLDRATVAAFLLLTAVGIATIGWVQTGTLAGVAWTLVKVLLVPWLAWNWVIGWAVYLQHISPEMPWHSRRRWRKFVGQAETTTNFRMPHWLNFFWHNIFVHVPHHVDPRIPFYNLPAAAAAMARMHAGVAPSKPFHFRTYVEATERCKLYDFDKGEWMGYEGVLGPQGRQAPEPEPEPFAVDLQRPA